MSRKLAFLATTPLWASFAMAQATFTNAGGSVSQDSSLVVSNSIVANAPGTLAFTCPLTAFAAGGSAQNWACAGGSFTLQSSDGLLKISATFDSGSRLRMTSSGGGVGGPPTTYSYTLTANIIGTIIQNGQPPQPTTGTTVQSYTSVGTRLDRASGAGTFGSGTTTLSDHRDDRNLYYPRFPLNSDEFTGIGLSDLGRTAASLQFMAFDRAGRAVSGANSPTPASRIIGPGAQLPIVDDQLFAAASSDAALPGWGKIVSSTSSVTGFFLTFNRGLTSMDGADLSQTLMPFSVLPEIGDQGYTRMFLANPNSDAASITIELVRSDGTVRSTIEASIAANGTFSGDLKTDVFKGIVPDASDYVRVTSDQGLLHYESFGKVSGDIAVLAGQDLINGAGTLYAPQYVVGGPWRSTLSIVNLGPDPGSVTLRLIGDDGVQKGKTQTLTIAGGGKVHVSDQSFFGSSSAGSADQRLQGYVEVTGSGMRLTGSVVFGDVNAETFSTTMPLVSTLGQSMVLSQVASNETYFTGVAIVNPNDSSVRASIDLYNADGMLLNTVEQVIPAGQRKSRLLTEIFPGTAGQDLHSGYIKVSSDKGVACFGVFGTHDLSILSAIPASPAP